MTVLLTTLLLSLISGMAADAYVNVLTQPDHVLAFWARWLYALADKLEQKGVDRDKLDFWLKPILCCEYCVAGELAFWLSLYLLSGYHIYIIVFSLLCAACAVWMAGVVRRLRTGRYHGN